MKNTAIFVLVVTVAVLGYLLHSQNTTLAAQQRQIQDLNGKVETRVKSTSLELQGQCSKQARDQYDSKGWREEPMASYTNHYNDKLNKCFLLIQNTALPKTKTELVVRMRVLIDAFEGKAYAGFTSVGSRAMPDICNVTSLTGEEKQCHSSDEFDELVKQYME
jgi:hypothetical protein